MCYYPLLENSKLALSHPLPDGVSLQCFWRVGSFYYRYSSLEKGDIMWVFWLGIALVITAVYMGGYFLRHQNQDSSSNQMDRIEDKLDKVIKLLEDLVERFDRRNNQE